MANNRKEDFLASEIEKDLENMAVSEDISAETEEKDNKSEEKKQSKIKEILHSRKFARGWLFAAVIAVFLACVIAVNVIVSVLENRFPSLTFDITSSNMYELQDETKKLCDSLEKDIQLYLLTDEDNFKSFDSMYGTAYFTQANQLFKEIAGQSSHIKFDYVDVSSNPSFSSEYSNLNLTTSGADTILIVDAGDDKYKGYTMTDLFVMETDESGYKTITGSQVEQTVCTAILGLTKKNSAKACFITSSGVPAENESSTGESVYTSIKTLLKNQAYDTATVDIDSNQKIPSDCDILLFVAPTQDVSESGLEKIENFLDTAKKTNKTFVYVPNPFKVEDGTPNLDSFLETQGIKVGDSMVYEQSDKYLSSMYPDDHTLSLYDYDNEDFTSGIDTATKILMGYTRPITFTEGSNAVSLLNSSDKADTLPFTAKSESDVVEGNGKPISGAAINQSEVTDGVYKNTVVIGSYYALSEDFLNTYTQYNNANYFVNMFNILTENEGETVVITSAKASDTSLGLQAESQTTIPSVIFLGVLPIGILILGIVIWAVRRKK
ncbi:MAG: GldG family protein [Ruminococcus sp.]|nr:GldG family protein [Ruminococcus sp.]